MHDTLRIVTVTPRLCSFLWFLAMLFARSHRKGFEKMKKRWILTAVIMLALFAIWTELVQIVDVQCIGQTQTKIGFAAINGWFHQLTGVHMRLYHLTDWLGLIPVAVCLMFAAVGALQMLKRKSLLKVDQDILFLGIYYVLVIMAYLIFESMPINYRPIFLDGRLEASYPSSTTLLVLSVMPTLHLQVCRRVKSRTVKRTVLVFVIVFSVFMVFGRAVSGVHWLTDIAGSLLLSAGLFCMYQASVV